MIHQPKKEGRNVNDAFYKAEGRKIACLNEVLGDIELTKDEEKSFIWLAGWEQSTLENIISVFLKSKKK